MVEQIPYAMDFSVKLSQMGLDIGKELCRKNVTEILNAAKKPTVRFDMEGSDSTQRTIDLCLDLHESYKNLGIALQVCLHRNQADVQTMVDKGISVRLCKGAHKESPEIAYQSMDEIREYFLK